MLRIVCLNPVIDRMYYIDNFTASQQYKEIQPQIFVGGKGVNTARVIALLGEKCELYGFVGGANGKLVIEDMESNGVDFTPFYIKGETRTTINIINRNNHMETEITEPGVQIGIKEEEQFIDRLANDINSGDMIICSGIPMKGMSSNIYQKISFICENKGAKCVLDANSDYLRNSFPGKYFFMKPNFDELLDLFQTKCECNIENIIKFGKRALKMGVNNILVSTGGEGGILLGEDGIYQAIIPDEPIVSTIGSGDATVSGFCVAYIRGMSFENCLRYGMACGICNAKFSKVGYVEKEMVDDLYSKVIANRIV